MTGRPVYTAPRVRADEGDPFAAAPRAAIACCPWPSHPASPPAEARLCHTGDALLVRLTAWERDPRVTCRLPNQPVYEDSCLECFVAPLPGREAFCDFECNAAGTLLVGRFCEGDFGLVDPAARPGVTAAAQVLDDRWQVDLRIPLAFLAAMFPVYIPGAAGLRVNFFKCGDKTARPHYACWSPITAPEISFFHAVDFGDLILAD